MAKTEILEPGLPAREPHASSGVKQGVHAWGTRLSGQMRAALVGRRRYCGRQLALHGDGQTRDLAREYAFMIHGLGFTLQILLRLLLEVAAGGQAQDGVAVHAASAAEADLAALLTRAATSPWQTGAERQRAVARGRNAPRRCWLTPASVR